MTPDSNMEPRDSAPDTSAQACLMIDRIVTFFLGGQRYAFPIQRVREIQQIVAFSEVPEGGTGIVGMVNLRGAVIPAIDMRRLVGMEARAYSLETPMVIAEINSELVALLVDEVQDVFELPADCITDAPSLHKLSDKMVGVARLEDGLVYVLDLDKLLGSGFHGGGHR